MGKKERRVKITGDGEWRRSTEGNEEIARRGAEVRRQKK